MNKIKKENILKLQNCFKDKNLNKICFSNYQDKDILDIVEISNIKKIDMDSKKAIFNKIKHYGFSIVKIKDVRIDQNIMTEFSNNLSLGNPFISPYYRGFSGGIEVHSGINTIGKSESNGDIQENITHDAFSTNKEQKLHVDGTVQKIGHVKTSIVLCHTKAKQGGLSTFFNSSAAFYSLFKHDQKAALAMMDNKALSRAVDTDKNNPYTDSVIAVNNTGIISRFSLDRMSNWQTGFRKVKHLKKAYDFFVEHINEGSPFYRELLLNEGEAVIISNSRISYGRTSYVSYPQKERKMYRALYEKSPN